MPPFRATDGRPFSTHVLRLHSAEHVRPRQLYRGSTANLKQRLSEHNAGKCPHTAKYLPWTVKFYAAFESIELAANMPQTLVFLRH